MGISGRLLEKDLDLEKVKETIFEEFGRVVKISQKLGCSDKAVYELLEMHPELQEARAKASSRYRDKGLEIAEGVVERLMRLDVENPELAAKQAQFIMKNSKISPYNNEFNKNSNDNDMDAAKDLTRDIETQIEDDKTANAEAKC